MITGESLAEEAGVEKKFNEYIYQILILIFCATFCLVPTSVPNIDFGAGHPTHALFFPIITKPLLSEPSISPVHVNQITTQLFGLKPDRAAVFR